MRIGTLFLINVLLLLLKVNYSKVKFGLQLHYELITLNIAMIELLVYKIMTLNKFNCYF